jgi:DNA-binding IscR family transcriptional regulator
VDEKLLVLIGLVAFIGLVSLFLIVYLNNLRNSGAKSHWISDQEILKMIYNKPDRFLSVKDLAIETQMSNSMARRRLAYLSMHGAIKSYFTDLGTSSYSLKTADQNLIFTESPIQKLSFQLMLDLFVKNQYKLSVAKIIAGTGLNLKEVKKAISEFKRDKVVYTMQDYSGNKVILLREPYKGNLAALNTPIAQQNRLDLDQLAEIIRDRKKMTSKDLSRLNDIPEDEAENLLDQLAKQSGIRVEINNAGDREYLYS